MVLHVADYPLMSSHHEIAIRRQKLNHRSVRRRWHLLAVSSIILSLVGIVLLFLRFYPG